MVTYMDPQTVPRYMSIKCTRQTLRMPNFTMDSSVHHSDSQSVNLSPSAANPLKIPCNYGEKNAVNYLHKNLVKSPSVSTLYISPLVHLSVHHAFNPSIHRALHLSLHPSMHHPYNLSIDHALHLSLHLSMHHPLHPSMHCPICSSIPTMMNVRNSQMDSQY